MRIFYVDPALVVCMAAAWLIEFTLGSLKIFRFIPDMAGRFIGVAALRAFALSARFGKRREKGAAFYKISGLIWTLYFTALVFLAVAVISEQARGAQPVVYYLTTALICCGMFSTRSAIECARSQLKTADEGDSEEIWNSVCALGGKCVGGAIAPVMFISVGALLGLPAAFCAAYCALSAIGIAAERGGDEFLGLGRAAAAMREAADYVPSGLFALILPFMSPLCGVGPGGVRRGLRATRDRHSADEYAGGASGAGACAGGYGVWPAAALAGTLGICAGKANAAYLNIKDEKIRLRVPEPRDIARAVRLTAAASAFAVLAGCGILTFCFISIR